jgi:hypothetical protein
MPAGEMAQKVLGKRVRCNRVKGKGYYHDGKERAQLGSPGQCLLFGRLGSARSLLSPHWSGRLTSRLSVSLCKRSMQVVAASYQMSTTKGEPLMKGFMRMKLVLNFATVVMIAASVALSLSGSTAYAHTASAPVTAVYVGVHTTGVLISTTPPSLVKRIAPSNQHRKDFSPLPDSIPYAGVKVNDSGLVPGAAEGSLRQNFNGLSDADSAAVNKGEANTPPDQGLCVGSDPGVPGKVVFEIVNEVVRETTPDGSALPGTPLLRNQDFSLDGFFDDPNVDSDPRCFYDRSTGSFYFTVISAPNGVGSFFDVAVFNAKGFHVYQFNDSFGGLYYGDQPHVGYDRNNLYVSTDEYSTKSARNNLYVSTDEYSTKSARYAGAALFAISKSQLIAEGATPSMVRFGPLRLGGHKVKVLQPAVSTTSTGTEYLLNSFASRLSRQLGLWTVHNGAAVTTGSRVTLTGTLIQTEAYMNPVPALSTGSGKTTNGITSEAALQVNRARMEQVEFIDGHLWAALPTAVRVNGDEPVTRDGIAWFEVDPVRARVTSQGYIASRGRYLIYPAIMHTSQGTTAIVFTATSPGLNPSAAYVVRKSDATHFGGIGIAARGTNPHISDAETDEGRPRWGDYSAATLDPNGRDIWLATEYIPPRPNQNPLDNWGTRVFDIRPR